MRTLPLTRTASVVLDGSGNGTASSGPASAGESWTVAQVAVSASSNTKEAQCKVFAGASATAQSYAGGTLSGSTGDSTTNLPPGPVYPGYSVWAQWAGGDAGATATMVVTGIRTVP